MTAATRGRWIPWTYAGGMLVVVAVNAVLITAAFRSFPGLVVQRPYDRGIAYNEELRQGRAQAALGWELTPAYDKGRFTVRVVASNGSPVAGLDLRAKLSRPLEAMAPIDVTLIPEGDEYVAAVDLPRSGQWDIKLLATGAEGTYRGLYRLIVK